MIWEAKSRVVVTPVKMEQKLNDLPVAEYWAKEAGGKVNFWNLSIATKDVFSDGKQTWSRLEVKSLKVRASDS